MLKNFRYKVAKKNIIFMGVVVCLMSNVYAAQKGGLRRSIKALSNLALCDPEQGSNNLLEFESNEARRLEQEECKLEKETESEDFLAEKKRREQSEKERREQEVLSHIQDLGRIYRSLVDEKADKARVIGQQYGPEKGTEAMMIVERWSMIKARKMATEVAQNPRCCEVLGLEPIEKGENEEFIYGPVYEEFLRQLCYNSNLSPEEEDDKRARIGAHHRAVIDSAEGNGGREPVVLSLPPVGIFNEDENELPPVEVVPALPKLGANFLQLPSQKFPGRQRLSAVPGKFAFDSARILVERDSNVPGNLVGPVKPVKSVFRLKAGGVVSQKTWPRARGKRRNR